MSHKTIITAIVTVLQDHQQRSRDKQPKKLITAPPQLPNSMDQLLQYVAAINGQSNMQLAQMNPDITPMLGTSKSTSSEDSSPSSSQTSPSYDMEEEETSDDESIASTTSDRQLRPCAPISYNETLLKQLHGQLQVRTFNNLSIPLPSDSTEEDIDSEVSETDEESEQFV